MFRWGILSAAKIAREQVMPAIAESSNGMVMAVAARDLDRAQALARQFSAPLAFGSYEGMLESDSIDGVYIPAATAHHVEWTVRAAEAGKHVLCEKPIALKAEEIGALIAARDHYGVTISEAFMVHYHPQWQAVASLIAEGRIGTLRHVQGVFTFYTKDPANTRNQLDLGGGALPDIGVYPTVTTRIATGIEPQRIQATIERDAVFGTDIYAAVKADFGSFDLSFYCSTQMALRQKMVFHGDEGFIEVHAPFNPPEYGQAVVEWSNRTHDRAELLRFPKVRQYRDQVETFVEAAEGRGGRIFTLENSLANQRVIDAIYRAGESGGWAGV